MKGQTSLKEMRTQNYFYAKLISCSDIAKASKRLSNEIKTLFL